MNKICGNCKSRDLKQIGAVYDQLKVRSSGRAVGVGMGGGRLGVGAMGTSGSSQPELVKKIERKLPKKMNIIKLVIFGILTFLFYGPTFSYGIEGNAVGLIIGTIFLILTYVEFDNGKNYKKNLDRSNRTWYCFSCGQFRIYKK